MGFPCRSTSWDRWEEGKCSEELSLVMKGFKYEVLDDWTRLIEE